MATNDNSGRNGHSIYCSRGVGDAKDCYICNPANDNSAMVEAAMESAFAKAFDAGCKITTGNYFGSNTDEKTRVMFTSIWDSALEHTSHQSALAVAAERTRIADRFSELREGHKAEGFLHCTCDGCGRLVEYINELRADA